MSSDQVRTEGEDETGVSGQTVVVTGGAGFIGSHLAAALTAHNEVRVVDDLSAGSAEKVPEDAELYRADLREAESLEAAMDDVDVVFHQAGLSSVPESISDPMASHGRNATGTLRVLESARRHDARVVVASSAAVYGEPSTLPISEDHPKEPTSPYGVDKLTADHYARVYANRYGLQTVTLRYFNVYGPGQSGPAAGVVAAFLDRATAGRPLVVHGDGEQTRDFVHVSDVVRINLLAAETEATGKAFNVGSGTTTTIDRLATIVQSTVNDDVTVERGDPRDGDIKHSCADISRARRLLGYDPQVSLTEGIRALADREPIGPGTHQD